MNFTQLRYFCEVCRQGNVTRGAEALYVSQPSVSVAIRELEAEYGLPLFDRQKKRLILTEDGRFFYEKALKILEIVDSLDLQMKNLALKRHAVRIGVSPLSGLFVFFPIFHKFQEQYPEISLEMCENGSMDSMNQLEAKQLDFAIVVSNSYAEDRFDVLPLVETNMLFCISKQHRLANAKSLRFEDIANEKLIMMNSSSYQIGALIKNRFDELGIIPNILLRSNHLEAINQCILNYNAGTIQMKEVLQFCPDIIGIPLEPEIKVSIVLIKNKKAYLNREALVFYDFVNRLRGDGGRLEL